MQIINSNKNTTVCRDAVLANSFWTRFKGLMGRKSLEPDQGLIITRCQSVHMMFMSFPIDVIFLDRAQKVVGVVTNIKPWMFSPVFWNAYYAVELVPNAAAQGCVEIGDTLSW